jgi:AcrR family transcriptional regulator
MIRRVRLDAATRRESILIAAIPLFAANGYERTRVSDIAAQVGVTEPVVFQNFGTKADLFLAVLERVAGDALRQLAELAEAIGDVPTLLAHILSVEHLDWMHTQHAFGLLFHQIRHLDADPRFTDAMHRTQQQTADVLAMTLRRGQRQGSIRDELDPDSTAWMLLSLVAAREMRRAHAPWTSAQLEAELTRAVVDLLRPRAG